MQELSALRNSYEEQRALLQELTSQRMAPPAPVQVLINNTTAQQPEHPPPPVFSMAQLLHEFFSADEHRANRAVFYSAVVVGLYVMQGHCQHKWRMAEFHRRSEANLFF